MSNTPKGRDGGKSYPIGLAGESNYQEAICVCREGEPVRVCHEVGNPHDDDALVVVSSRNETIGYIPKSSWLRDAIYDEGNGCEATIKSIQGEREPMGVVIDVHLTDGQLESREYARAPAAGGATGCLLAFGAFPLTLMLASLFGD